MRISYGWLKKRFKNLPDPQTLAEKIIFGVFEVESVDSVDHDSIIDLKILPDRAHYALSWNGIAYEVGALIGEPYKADIYENISGSGNGVEVIVEDSNLCKRYMARVVKGIKVTDSPEWLKSELEKIGQRSINSLVDLANYVMFTTGQPLHIFDLDKVQSPRLAVRQAREGEKIECLDGNTYELSRENLVIADDSRALAIAGVKGGKFAEVTRETKNILIESANFDPVSIRKTATKLKLKSDAAKRYENEPSSRFCEMGMNMISALINQENSEADFGEVADVYPNPEKTWTLEIDKEYIESRLGRKISDQDVLDVLERIQCKVFDAKNSELKTKNYVIEPPFFRLDLMIEDDMVEEIGRLLGYDKVKEVLPPKVFTEPSVDREFYLSEVIKDALVQKGFSETILYTLGEAGKLETLYPVAKDKAFLRESLLPHLEESVLMNTRNADLLELDVIKEFEIGKVFSQDGESLMLGIAVGFAKKIKGQKPVDVLKQAFAGLTESLGCEFNFSLCEKDLIAFGEASLQNILGKVEIKDPYQKINFGEASENKFKPFSKYPFSTRDVAVFVPNGITEREVEALIREKAGSLCVKLKLFDVFTKDQDGQKKTSYAFRLVFQADDRTLVEEEINGPLQAVYAAFQDRGWEAR